MSIITQLVAFELLVRQQFYTALRNPDSEFVLSGDGENLFLISGEEGTLSYTFIGEDFDGVGGGTITHFAAFDGMTQIQQVELITPISVQDLQTSSQGDVTTFVGQIYGPNLTFLGTADNDTWTGEAGNDQAAGGDGDDTFYMTEGNDGYLGNGGIDTLNFVNIRQSVDLSLLRGTYSLDGSHNSDFEGFENVHLSNQDDRAIGDGRANYMMGLRGSDTIRLGGGDDTAMGGGGSDSIFGQGGDDTLSGNGGGDILDGGGGTNILRGGGGSDTLLGGWGNNRMFGNSGNDMFYFSGQGLIDGGGGRDTASGSNLTSGFSLDLKGNFFGYEGEGYELSFRSLEILIGSAFNDNFVGDNKANLFRGGSGADSAFGGGGDDTLDGNGGNDLLEGGGGSDTLNGGGGADDLVGGSGDDNANGGDGKDNLEGGTGEDVLNGGAGNDDLDGGRGADELTGGNGDDTIEGGLGDDLLTGGAGSDKFVYYRGDGDDVIQDFNPSRDTFCLIRPETLDLSIVRNGSASVLRIETNSGSIATVTFLDNRGLTLSDLGLPEQTDNLSMLDF